MKGYLKEKGISIYRLSSDSGVPYSTLNDLVNGKVSVDNCKVGMIKALANALDMPIDTIYDMLARKPIVVKNSYGVEAHVSVRHKSYFVTFDYMGENHDEELCRVNEDTTYYVKDIAKCRSESLIRKERMKKL